MVAKTLIGEGVSTADADKGTSPYWKLVASMEKLQKESYIKTVTASTNYFPQADLTKIQVPTLLLFGSGDKLTPPEAGRIMQAEIKTSSLIVFEGTGHLVNLEEPLRFNETVLGFPGPHKALYQASL